MNFATKSVNPCLAINSMHLSKCVAAHAAPHSRSATRALYGGGSQQPSDRRLILPGAPGHGPAQQSGERHPRLIIPPGPGSRGPTSNGNPPAPPAPTSGDMIGDFNFRPPPGFFRDPEAATAGAAQADDGPDVDTILRRISSMAGVTPCTPCTGKAVAHAC